MMKRLATLGLAALLPLAAACEDDDGPTEPTVEATEFLVTVENVSQSFDFVDSGVFATPVGASEAGPLTPGNAYEIEFGGAPGHRLFFATMFVQSNDFFYGPDENGIALYDGSGNPVSGDVTDQIALWDAGTEIDQEPGLGEDQAPNQSGPDTGAPDPDNSVRLAEDTFGNLPPVSDVVRVTLTPLDGGRFRLTIENVSDASTLTTSDGGSGPVVLAPGVVAVGSGSEALFTVGSPDRGEGLEALAEDGNASTLASSLAEDTGLTSPLAPGAWAVHRTAGVLFAAGQPDRGEGLEALAEDGNPAPLAESLGASGDVLSSGVFNTPSGASQPGPLLPGSSYTFTVMAEPGDRLSFATMLVQSNDLFYGPSGAGLALFSGSDTPLSGDVTSQIQLWDAGTEANEQPGVGPNQAPRQSGADTGPAENGTVRVVNDEFSYPAVESVVRVTVTPAG